MFLVRKRRMLMPHGRHSLGRMLKGSWTLSVWQGDLQYVLFESKVALPLHRDGLCQTSAIATMLWQPVLVRRTLYPTGLLAR